MKIRVLRRAAFPQDGMRPETAILLARVNSLDFAVFTEVDCALRNGYYSRDFELCVAEYELRKRTTANPGEKPIETIFRRSAK